jgi:hypothetical protein
VPYKKGISFIFFDKDKVFYQIQRSLFPKKNIFKPYFNIIYNGGEIQICMMNKTAGDTSGLHFANGELYADRPKSTEYYFKK